MKERKIQRQQRWAVPKIVLRWVGQKGTPHWIQNKKRLHLRRQRAGVKPAAFAQPVGVSEANREQRRRRRGLQGKNHLRAAA